MSKDVPLLVWNSAQWDWSAEKTNMYSIRKNTNKSKVSVHTMKALHRVQRSALYTRHFTPKKKPPQYSERESWVGLRASLDASEKGKMSWSYWESNRSSSVVQPVPQSPY
jgi:hypothetical protein